MVRLLDDSEFRLIRSSGDLHRMLLEELHGIEQTARRDLAIFYYGRGGERKRMNESALQTYIRRRLSDRLPSRLRRRPTVVFLDRETEEADRRRLDIKVQAQTLNGHAATAVIEIKWSDNRQVSTSLPDQLGEKYLLANGWTHGIYLVGWLGHGRWSAAADSDEPRDRHSLESWRAAFEKQARAFESKHPGTHIGPVVIDLSWVQSG